MKIDVEEQESMVLAGLEETILHYKPLILMEVVGRTRNFEGFIPAHSKTTTMGL